MLNYQFYDDKNCNKNISPSGLVHFVFFFFFSVDDKTHLVNCGSRLVGHRVRPAGREREGHPLRGGPHLRWHPQVQEASGLEDLPHRARAHQGAANVGEEEEWEASDDPNLASLFPRCSLNASLVCFFLRSVWGAETTGWVSGRAVQVRFLRVFFKPCCICISLGKTWVSGCCYVCVHHLKAPGRQQPAEHQSRPRSDEEQGELLPSHTSQHMTTHHNTTLHNRQQLRPVCNGALCGCRPSRSGSVKLFPPWSLTHGSTSSCRWAAFIKTSLVPTNTSNNSAFLLATANSVCKDMAATSRIKKSEWTKIKSRNKKTANWLFTK